MLDSRRELELAAPLGHCPTEFYTPAGDARIGADRRGRWHRQQVTDNGTACTRLGVRRCCTMVTPRPRSRGNPRAGSRGNPRARLGRRSRGVG
jgi:hypothetical protein